MFQNLNDDEVRELKKVLSTLKSVEAYFKAQGQMNARLHMSDEVLYSPLASKVMLRASLLQQQLARHMED